MSEPGGLRDDERWSWRRFQNRGGRYRRFARIRLLALTALLLAGLAVSGGLALAGRPAEEFAVQTLTPPVTNQPLEPTAEPESPTPEAPGPSVTPKELEARIGEIAEYYGGDYGVVVFDPDSGREVSLRSEKDFFAASLGKLPTLISLYKSAERGEVDLDAEISILASDVQSYGTGLLHTYPVGTTMTLRECAYYLMNVSDNTAWAMLTRYLGVETIQADLTAIGAHDTEYWVPNTTTLEDVLLMLRRVAEPSFTSPELSNEMLAAMTDTAFEDRIPGGLPPDVRVAHKIGSYESSFSDAGVVFYKDRNGVEHHYFVVVFAENVGEATARAAIQEISRAAHEALAER